jgi:thiamine kinase-like enzyme
LITAFEGEPAVPCHRDDGPANWLVTDDGHWAGVIDFEFARSGT